MDSMEAWVKLCERTGRVPVDRDDEVMKGTYFADDTIVSYTTTSERGIPYRLVGYFQIGGGHLTGWEAHNLVTGDVLRNFP